MSTRMILTESPYFRTIISENLLYGSLQYSYVTRLTPTLARWNNHYIYSPFHRILLFFCNIKSSHLLKSKRRELTRVTTLVNIKRDLIHMEFLFHMTF